MAEISAADDLSTELRQRGLMARLMLLDGSPYFSLFPRRGGTEVFGCDSLQEIKTFIAGWDACLVFHGLKEGEDLDEGPPISN